MGEQHYRSRRNRSAANHGRRSGPRTSLSLLPQCAHPAIGYPQAGGNRRVEMALHCCQIGRRPFGVTAEHVIVPGLETGLLCLQRGSSSLGVIYRSILQDRHAVIDRNDVLDIATFRIAASEVGGAGQDSPVWPESSWRPAPPHEGRGIYLGLRGQGNRSLALRVVLRGCSGTRSGRLSWATGVVDHVRPQLLDSCV